MSASNIKVNKSMPVAKIQVPEGAQETQAPPEESKARLRWKALFGHIQQVTRSLRLESEIQREQDGLIEELRREQKKNKSTLGHYGEDVFATLKSQASLTEKVFARQKFSAKEILRKSIQQRRSSGFAERERRTWLYDEEVRRKYPITPEIQKKIDEFKEKKERKANKPKKIGIFEQLFSTSLLGQTLLANPRFYSMDPLVHFPDLCRRCRHPLSNGLIAKFSPAGIIFALLIPILGILLLYANQEFHCVVCGESYVYGDLTARPESESSPEDEKK